MRNAGLEETQAGIKIARRNINNVRYAEDSSFMTESDSAISFEKWEAIVWRIISQYVGQITGGYMADQISSVAQSCPTRCDPMNCSTPGLPVHHQFPESTQTHVHWVGDAIQPSHPLLSPFSPAFIFPSIRVFSNEPALRIGWPKYWSPSSTPVLPMNTQDWSPLGWTSWISLQSKGLSRVFSNTTVQKHQYLCIGKTMVPQKHHCDYLNF